MQKNRTFKAMAVLTLGLFGFAGPSAAGAAEQFWISLGSYGQLAGAEKVRDQAAITFNELKIVSSDTPVGFVYRVLQGPMASHSAAEERLDQARVAGYIDAWILSEDSSKPMGTLEVGGSFDSDSSYPDSSYPDSTSGDSYSGAYALENSASGEVLADYTQDYSTTNDSDAPSADDYDAVSIGNEELVETAPEGYGLHRLERSNQTLPPGEAVESRLHELRSDPK